MFWYTVGMRLKIVFRRAAFASFAVFAILGSVSCASTAPAAAATPDAASAPADRAPVPAPAPVPLEIPAAAPQAAPAPAPAPAAEKVPEPQPAPAEKPERPVVVRRLAAPARPLPKMLSEEPETPFGESDPVVLPPAETVVALSDAPLPVSPALPDPPKPATVERVPPKPPVPAFPEQADERPSVTAPTAPPGAAKSAPAKPVQPKKESAKVPDTAAKESAAAPPFSEMPARSAPLPLDERIDFSRSVRILSGQLLEIPYRGAGWIFLGERNAKKGLPYDSRRLDEDGQSFMFRAELPGTYALKFYRQDFVADYIVNDYVQVLVDPSPAATSVGGFSVPVDRGRVVAEPRWPPAAASRPASSPAVEAVPSPASSAAAAPAAAPAAATSAAVPAPAAAPAATAAATVPAPAATPAAAAPALAAAPAAAMSVAVLTPAAAPAAAPNGAQGGTRPADSGIVREASAAPARSAALDPASIPANAAMDEYLSIARTESDAGRIASALAVLDRSMQVYPAGSDELLWLYGRLLEANGPTKDVKASLSYYKKLIEEYPQSPRYDEAVKRAAYLERYFFEIR